MYHFKINIPCLFMCSIHCSPRTYTKLNIHLKTFEYLKRNNFILSQQILKNIFQKYIT